MSELSFADFGLRWFEDIVERVTEWFRRELTAGLEGIAQDLFTTPLPEGQGVGRVLSKPSAGEGLWRGIYEATVAGEMTAVGLLILLVSVQLRHFVRIFDFGSAHERRRARHSAWTGAFLIVTWYWVALLALSVVQGFTVALLPDVNSVSQALLSILPQAVETPTTTLLLAAVGGLSVLALRALFFLREVLLYVFLYVMPVGLGLAYGHVPVASRVARGLCAQFVPLALLPLPAALLFRGYGFLFTGASQFPVEGSFVRYLVVTCLPLVALYVTWKTFKYASPLAARLLGTAGRGTLLLGTVAGTAAIAGPKAATIAGRYGPRGAAGAVIADRYGSSGTANPSTDRRTGDTDEGDSRSGGVPAYRRPENDPGYY